MKFSVFLICIACAMSLILGYVVYSVAGNQEYDVLSGFIGAFSFMITLIPLMGISFSTKRLTVNLKVLSSIAFTAMVGVNFTFAALEIVMPYYPVTIALIALVYIAIMYIINSTKQF